jgi:hypothetical protein
MPRLRQSPAKLEALSVAHPRRRFRKLYAVRLTATSARSSPWPQCEYVLRTRVGRPGIHCAQATPALCRSLFRLHITRHFDHLGTSKLSTPSARRAIVFPTRQRQHARKYKALSRISSYSRSSRNHTLARLYTSSVYTHALPPTSTVSAIPASLSSCAMRRTPPSSSPPDTHAGCCCAQPRRSSTRMR